LPPQGSPAEKGQPSPDLGFSASSLRPPFSRASEPYPDARIPAYLRASLLPRRNPFFLKHLRCDGGACRTCAYGSKRNETRQYLPGVIRRRPARANPSSKKVGERGKKGCPGSLSGSQGGRPPTPLHLCGSRTKSPPCIFRLAEGLERNRKDMRLSLLVLFPRVQDGSRSNQAQTIPALG